MYLFLVILLGLALRFTYIVKPEGLWNDEYVSWFVASTPFNQGFWSEVFKQCHMPLYYLYLKPFTHCSDLVLRITSVLPSVLAIYIMYLVGKEYSEKCAKIAAFVTSILPFLVYYSQEVRFYSLVFLFSAAILLCAIRILKGVNKAGVNKNDIVLYSIFSILLIFTHVLGVIYVFFMTLILLFKTKLVSKKILAAIGIVLLAVLPFAFVILKQLPSAQWWGVFSYTNILFLFSDFYSPILSNHVNAPPVFYYKSDWLFKALITIPTLIALTGIVLGIKKLKSFISVVIGMLIVTVILALSGKIVFITKYVIEIFPILILGLAIGFDSENIIKKILLYLFIFINLFSILTVYYPSKIPRAEGNNLPAIILNEQKPDNIIFTYYAPDRFYRYLNTNAKMKHISKINRLQYKDNPAEILKDIPSGESVSVVFLNSVSFIPKDRIKESEQRNLPEMFITFSKIKYSLEDEVKKNFRNLNYTTLGQWTVLNGVKG